MQISIAGLHPTCMSKPGVGRGKALQKKAQNAAKKEQQSPTERGGARKKKRHKPHIKRLQMDKDIC